MTKVQSFLSGLPMFQGLREHELSQISLLFKERFYRKGQIIFIQGDVGHEVYIVHTGLVKIVQLNDEKELILAIFGEGEYFGEMAILDPSRRRSATAEVMEDASIFVMNQADFVKLLEQNTRLMYALLQISFTRIRETNELIRDITTLDARSRLLKTIQKLATHHGTPSQSGIQINVKLTHQQLADLTGIARETTSKILLELQAEGLITIEKKKIWIKNIAQLTAPSRK